MNKERTTIDLNGVVIFNGDVTDEELKIIPKNFCGDIVVYGDISLEKDCYIPCNLWIIGDLYCDCNRAIHVKGDCCCEGFIDSGNIKVDGDLYCKGYIDAFYIKVAGDFIVLDNLFHEGDIRSQDIITAGDLFCEGRIFSNNIIILGDLKSEDDIECGIVKEVENLHCEGINASGIHARGKIIAKEIDANGHKIMAKAMKVKSIKNYSKLIIGC